MKFLPEHAPIIIPLNTKILLILEAKRIKPTTNKFTKKSNLPLTNSHKFGGKY